MTTHTRYRQSVILLLALFLSLTAWPVSVWAEGTTSISLSNQSVEVGKSIKVTVTGSDSSQLKVRYNDKVLTLINCSAEYTSSGNSISFTGKSANLTFSAKSAGTGDVIVESDALSGSSTSVRVAEAATPTPSETPSETPDKKKADSKEKGHYNIDGTAYVLSERYEENEIPKGFSRVTLKLHGGTYKELKTDWMTIVYLKPADKIKGKGEFYILDEATDSVTKMLLLGSLKGNYVILTEPTQSIGEGFNEASFTVGKKADTYKGYQYEGVGNDFYFVYGVSASGEAGWYSYDHKANTIQRANIDLLAKVGTATEKEQVTPTATTTTKIRSSLNGSMLEDLMDIFQKNPRTLMAIGVFAGVVLLIIIIDIILFRRKGDANEEMWPDEEETEPVVKMDTAPLPKVQQESRTSGNTGVVTVDSILDADDFEEANKAHNFSETGRIRMEVFRNTKPAESSGTTDGKVDLIDLNDL